MQCYIYIYIYDVFWINWWIVIDIIWESCTVHMEDVKEIMTNNVNMLY